MPYNKIEVAAVGYVYGDSTCGNRALYEVGLSGNKEIFIINIFLIVVKVLLKH